jgi:hypothetical protein
MSDDLYTELLQVPPGPRPPHHYELLGLPLFESDTAAIHAAVLRQTAELKRWALDPRPGRLQRVQEMLNEVNGAGVFLEDPAKKADYDRRLAEGPGVPFLRPEGPVASEEMLEPWFPPPPIPFHACPVCGARMETGDNVCRACGVSAHGEGEGTGRRAKAIALAIGIPLAVAALLAAGFLAGRGPARDSTVKRPASSDARAQAEILDAQARARRDAIAARDAMLSLAKQLHALPPLPSTAPAPSSRSRSLRDVLARAARAESGGAEAIERRDYPQAIALCRNAETLYRAALALQDKGEKALDARKRAEEALQMADRAFTTDGRPPLFTGGRQALAEGNKALDEAEDFDAASRLFEQARVALIAVPEQAPDFNKLGKAKQDWAAALAAADADLLARYAWAEAAAARQKAVEAAARAAAGEAPSATTLYLEASNGLRGALANARARQAADSPIPQRTAEAEAAASAEKLRETSRSRIALWETLLPHLQAREYDEALAVTQKFVAENKPADPDGVAATAKLTLEAAKEFWRAVAKGAATTPRRQIRVAGMLCDVAGVNAGLLLLRCGEVEKRVPMRELSVSDAAALAVWAGPPSKSKFALASASAFDGDWKSAKTHAQETEENDRRRINELCQVLRPIFAQDLLRRANAAAGLRRVAEARGIAKKLLESYGDLESVRQEEYRLSQMLETPRPPERKQPTYRVCRTCGGAGRITTSRWRRNGEIMEQVQVSERCPACNGAGRFRD